MKMKLAETRTSPDWKMSDLDIALSDLKLNKSRDHEGYANEIFKQDFIGMTENLLVKNIKVLS